MSSDRDPPSQSSKACTRSSTPFQFRPKPEKLVAAPRPSEASSAGPEPSWTSARYQMYGTFTRAANWLSRVLLPEPAGPTTKPSRACQTRSSIVPSRSRAMAWIRGGASFAPLAPPSAAASICVWQPPASAAPLPDRPYQTATPTGPAGFRRLPRPMSTPRRPGMLELSDQTSHHKRAVWVGVRTLRQRPKVVGYTGAGECVFAVRSVRLVLRRDADHFNRLLACSECGTELLGGPVFTAAE